MTGSMFTFNISCAAEGDQGRSKADLLGVFQIIRWTSTIDEMRPLVGSPLRLR